MPSLPSTIQLSGGHVDLSSRIQINTAIVGSPALAAETSICALTVLQSITWTTGVILIGSASFTAGTDGVSARMRLYHGTTAGTLIGDSGLVTVVAASLFSPVIIGLDAAPSLPNQTYTMSLTVGSASAISTVSQVRLVALVV